MAKQNKYEMQADTTKVVSTVTATGSPWKERIVDYLLEQPMLKAKIKDVLKETDEKHDPLKYRARKHCLDSQKTYMKQDLNVSASYDGEWMVLNGIIDTKTGNIHPFKKKEEKPAKK